MANGNSTFSVIGSDVTITGDISASVDLHVDGKIEGDIKCASLVQGEHSVIKGAVTAETARMSGKVSGSITAKELVILKTARIEGDVHYDALTIEQGAQVDGRFSPNSQRASSSTGAASAPAKPQQGDKSPQLQMAN
ncbi:polymer-forming cytoskeletal protein [Qipengyuania nanhaisediminis]|uniref:bactofilin family protein n=1 Tax=Qipengyuania nanhaisediminis TaxID=604088 RepID=UPI0038B324B0